MIFMQFLYLELFFALHSASCGGTDIMATYLKEPQGINVSLVCITFDNVTFIRWKKDETLFFIYGIKIMKLVTNFTSDRMSVDPATPTVLHISHVEESDEGIYTCEVATVFYPSKSQTWNLTIYPGDKHITGSQQQTYIIAAATIAIFTSVIIYGTVCVYRKISLEAGNECEDEMTVALFTIKPEATFRSNTMVLQNQNQQVAYRLSVS